MGLTDRRWVDLPDRIAARLALPPRSEIGKTLEKQILSLRKFDVEIDSNVFVMIELADALASLRAETPRPRVEETT
jgi:hypothetical protein